ncbi:MAG: ECF transporter S component [Lachnospiraceae bacterium]|nr:ECF transporter S component [Lachnospiraceae bacterium]
MNSKTVKIVGTGLLMAIVVVLQALVSGIRFGTFSITLTLVPIIIGAALFGPLAGALLGTVFGVVVLITDAGAFMAISIPGTIIVCILKGALAGLAAGYIYRLLEKKNKLLAVVVAGICAPVVNTGIFLLGCKLFFYDTIKGWAAASGYENTGLYMITIFVGLNFIVELLVNLVLSTTIVRIVEIGRKQIKINK